ncbi:MAG TPA: DNA topoisomerase VI subunit B [Anaeromyxobacteraceae bacterium]|nr:DNA topoisomerase VI subunit B [Anaeromyxobacteraceae bacterium]
MSPARAGKAAKSVAAPSRAGKPGPAEVAGGKAGKGGPLPRLVPPPEAEPAPAIPEAPAPRARRATAEQMAQKQREISISEFFTKNRHLLGFDNPSKALLTTIKEAVDNSLDACEEAGILPELTVEVRDLGYEGSVRAQGQADEPAPTRAAEEAGSARRRAEAKPRQAIDPGGAVPPDTKAELTKGEGKFVVVVEDNGPGIVKAQVPKIFGKLLYGSKFHRLKQARGQQGIGISAAAMYGQLTTGQPIQVVSRVGKGKPAHAFDIQIDTRKNSPVVTRDETLDDWHQEHGTRVELEIVANWQQGQRFVNRYVEHTALANPHATIHYLRPRQEKLTFPRAAEELPKEAVEIRPHPHGVELGALMLMAADSRSHDAKGFLQTSFSRVSAAVADEILKKTGWKKTYRPREVAADRELAAQLHQAIGETKIMAPPTNCLSPIGDELMRKGLVSFLSVIESENGEDETQLDLDSAGKKRVAKKSLGRRAEAQPEEAGPERAGGSGGQSPPDLEPGVEKIKGHNYFIATVTRPPRVYRGNPFQVEVGLAYGGSWPADKPVELFRFANRVPLLFQRGACGITEAVVKTDWRNYLLSQPRGSLPVGPMALLVHIASVWVPFTSESKEAVAHYPEIIREIQLAAQECGRKLAAYVRKRQHAEYQMQRRSIFELYIQEVAQAIGKITGRSPDPIKREFLKVASKVTEAELAKEDAKLEEMSEKITKRPRRAEAEEAD